jgi:uncharacterized protein (DUF169 family)
MDMKVKERFVTLWEKNFGGAELPVCFYYTDQAGAVELVKRPSGHRCLIADLYKARTGKTVCFDVDSIGCFGGKRYLGFTDEIMPNFEYFLSCGIAGKLEGERYKKTPELVKDLVKKAPTFAAPAKFIVFKRWDNLEESDEPAVVIFFGGPDVLSGLFTLANFDESGINAVFAPFAAGCGSIVQHPYLERDSEHPRAVIGMFDISARPFVGENVLTFAVSMNKFAPMVENMEESFLITTSWSKVKKRIVRS